MMCTEPGARMGGQVRWSGLRPARCASGDVADVVRQAEVDGGKRSGTSMSEAARIAELERENRELRRANEILRTVLAFSLGTRSQTAALQVTVIVRGANSYMTMREGLSRKSPSGTAVPSVRSTCQNFQPAHVLRPVAIFPASSGSR